MTVVINGSGTMTGLAVGGFNDNIITKNEMATGGAWAPAGTVLQVVQVASNYSQASTTSNTFQATSQTASITPTSATSKVLVIITNEILANSGTNIYATIYRNASVNLGNSVGLAESSGIGAWVPVTMVYLDSPATTSSTSYTTYFRSQNSGTSVLMNGDASLFTVTLMEIAA